MINAVPEWDKTLFYAINGSRNDVFDAVMPLFAPAWPLWALAFAAFSFGAARALRRKDAKGHLRFLLFGMCLMLATSGVTDLATRAAKDGIGRLRPSQSLPNAYFMSNNEWRRNAESHKPWRTRADSFFSGHAAHSMAVAVTASALFPPLSPVIYAMPAVVGYSRIYLGKHYPSDVAAGWLAGAAAALVARRVSRKARRALQPEEEPQETAEPESSRSVRAAKAAADIV